VNIKKIVKLTENKGLFFHNGNIATPFHQNSIQYAYILFKHNSCKEFIIEVINLRNTNRFNKCIKKHLIK